MTTLREALEAPERLIGAWIYLPRDRASWSLESECHALDTEDVAPEDEDEPDAGVPRWTLERGLCRVMLAADFQDVIGNARAQVAEPTAEILFRALLHYLRFDAFVDLGTG